MEEFILTKEHIALLRNANIRYNEGEYGAPGLDTKRPYGNSDIEYDIIGILNWDKNKYKYDKNGEMSPESEKEQEKLVLRANILHTTKMVVALQILCINAGKKVRLGRYIKKDRYDNSSWEFAPSEV